MPKNSVKWFGNARDYVEKLYFFYEINKGFLITEL